MAATASTQTESSVEAEADYIQVSYNIGGATLGLAMVDTDNSDYTETEKRENQLFLLEWNSNYLEFDFLKKPADYGRLFLSQT